VNMAGRHNILSDTHADTRVDPEEEDVQRGDLLTGQQTPSGADVVKWQRLAIGADATVLRSDGVDAAWSKVVLPGDVSGVLDVPHGGTGVSSLTDHAVLLGNGAGNIETVSGLGTAAQVLTSNGAGLDPTWQAAAGGGETHEDGYWAPLTDGDENEMELISAGGETIMMWIPTP